MTSIERHIRAKDIAVFKSVAQRFNVYIAVRRTNPAALPYIERMGYEPKQLNCKFKTADNDAVIFGKRRQLAGLVVNPRFPGMQAAFAGPKHYKAIKIWDDYARQFVWQSGDIPGSSKPYLVDEDRDSKHCGALKSGFVYTRRTAKFIHGDYDLYDIVAAADPTRHIVVREKRYGSETQMGDAPPAVPHVRVPEFMDIQNNLNIGFGAPMVRHGSQAGFSDFTEDDIDVFFPDGRTVKTCLGEAAIRDLYATEFKGRGHIHGGVEVESAGGGWIRPAP